MPKGSEDRVTLLSWTKMAPAVEGKDPLGLMGRVSNRLANQLLFCITSITPRARYYSFLPWCVADYRRRVKGRSFDRGLDDAVRLRERAYALGCIAHHAGEPCLGGRLVGTREARKWYMHRGSDVPKLTKLSFTETPALNNYYRSLVNLGLFVEHEDLGAEAASEEAVGFTFDDLELTDQGQSLASHYSRAINDLQCVRKIATQPDDCTLKELAAWGAHGGLCELADGGPELRILREIFFDDNGTSGAAHRLRRDTLVLLLDLLPQFGGSNLPLDMYTFNDATHFGEVAADRGGDEIVGIKINPKLRDIANRWRMFHFHYYLSVALETLFVLTVRRAREAGLRGVDLGELVAGLGSPATQKTIGRLLECRLPRNFLDMAPREIGSACGVSVPTADAAASEEFDKQVRLLHPLSESRLDYLIRNEAGFDTPEGAGLGLVMLSSMLMRYVRWEQTDFGRWLGNAVEDSYKDAAAPPMLAQIRSRSGDFWSKPWRELSPYILNRFVIRLHEALSLEKPGSGVKAFFQSDQRRVYWRGPRYDRIAVTNSRLGSALQILVDLGYAARKAGARDMYRPTTEGEGRLSSELQKMGGE